MKYRFLLTNHVGAIGAFEWKLKTDTAARKMATNIYLGVPFVQEVKIYRLLTDDSCGPITFIATVNRNEL